MARLSVRAGHLLVASLITCCLPALAATGTLAVTAVIPSKNICKFSAAALTATVTNNGTAINPALNTLATGSATMSFTCNGASSTATYSVAGNLGLNSNAPGVRRMRHTNGTNFLPYSLSISPQSGQVAKGVPVTLTVTASVLAFDYQQAIAGNYSDSVVLSITP